jgi:hypothetical protein
LRKLNCWEWKRCGRQPGGEYTSEFGVCPAATESRLDGAHGGANGGRACWVVAGTLCRGFVEGDYAKKLPSCLVCDFYGTVRKQEGEDWIWANSLLKNLGPD